MPFLTHLTRALYHAARLSNKARIAGAAIGGNLKPAAKYVRNRIIFRFIGRFLR